MKLNLAISAITAAALIGGGTYTAYSMTGGSRAEAGTGALPVPESHISATDDTDEGRDDARDTSRNDDRDDARDDTDNADPIVVPTVLPPAAVTAVPGSRTILTASGAADAALKKHPGAVYSVDLDDDRTNVWEVDLYGEDGRAHELRVDAITGSVTTATSDDDADDDAGDRAEDRRENARDRAALRATTVDVKRAVAAALASAPGSVTSVALDDEAGGRWEVDVRGKDGRTHELNVHPQTAKVTVEHDDDRGGDDDRYDD
ncbi:MULTISPECIES: PepSY domain-containing protein [unclassified Streptomyces]|uniref:PepSY domain-containing protein n=1 Tax=unclassified Streptomyces TaxID=2593676 RepID=UPI00380A760D